MASNSNESDLFSQLSPEQLAALLQGSTLQDQGGLLEQQLQQLLGSEGQHREYSTPLGAGLGGIAEALDGTANAFHVKALRGDQQKNLEAQSKLMGNFGELLRGPKDPAAEFGLPMFQREQQLSAPPMVDAGASPVPTSAPITASTDISAFPEVANLQLPGVPKRRGRPFSY